MAQIGVALTKCFFCNENDRIVLNKRPSHTMAKRVEEMHGKVLDHEPCAKCAEYMAQGVMLISTADGSDQSDEYRKNPYRTGKMVVVKADPLRRLMESQGVDPEVVFRIMAARWAFIEDTVWMRLGLPRFSPCESVELKKPAELRRLPGYLAAESVTVPAGTKLTVVAEQGPAVFVVVEGQDLGGAVPQADLLFAGKTGRSQEWADRMLTHFKRKQDDTDTVAKLYEEHGDPVG